MRIVLLLTRNKQTGPQKQTQYLADVFSREGYDAEIKYVFNNDTPKFFFDKFPNRLSDIISLIKFIKYRNPQLVISTGIVPDLFSFFFIFSKVKWFVVIRNRMSEDYQPKFGKFISKLLVFSHISTFFGVDQIICVSQSVQKKIGEVTKIDFFKSKTIVIRNSIDFDNCKNVISRGPTHTVMLSATPEPRKNLEFFLNIAQSLCSDFPSVQFNVVGTRPEEVDVCFLAPPNFTFVGFQDLSLSKNWNVDCMASASLSEGFPNIVLECLSMGVPALVSEIEPHLEISELSPFVRTFGLEYESFRDQLNCILCKVEDNTHIQSHSRIEFDTKKAAHSYLSKLQELIKP